MARISRTLPLGNIYMPDYRDMKILTLPEPLEVVKNWFKFSGIQQVIFPSTVKKICRCAFAGCKKLTYIRFEGESQLRVIEPNAFQETGLESFIAPRALRKIREGAFAKCDNMKLVWLNEGLTKLGSIVVEDTEEETEESVSISEMDYENELSINFSDSDDSNSSTNDESEEDFFPEEGVF